MSPKKVAITGSTGYIAGELIKELKDYEIIRLIKEDFKLDKQQLSEKIASADVIINLAGYPIIKRWTKSNKRKIYASRINTTSKLVDTISLLNKKIHLINTSATGIYSEEGIHDENSTSFSDGFIFKVLMDWEREAMKAASPLIKLTIIRIGIVLSKRSIMIKKIVPLFKLGVGGKIGNGRQWMSFIHIYDLVNSIRFIIEKEMEGVVNITAPNNTTNNEFTKEIASLMHKPAFLTVPVFILKLIYGNGAKIIYSDNRVFPEKLLNQGFKFKYPDINSALEEIIVH
jgi:uncharacterized protein (TIGR01777 family)